MRVHVYVRVCICCGCVICVVFFPKLVKKWRSVTSFKIRRHTHNTELTPLLSYIVKDLATTIKKRTIRQLVIVCMGFYGANNYSGLVGHVSGFIIVSVSA